MITNILLKDIQPNPWQTRVGEPDPEYIKALALDIAKNGLLQVPIGRRIADDVMGYQLAFGHNRLAAYKLLADKDAWQDEPVGYDAMPVDLRELTDQQMADYAWSENEKRRDVSPVERALAIQKRMESFEWSQAQVAEQLGLDRSTVSNLLRLLKLPDDLRANISKGEISERQAMALIPLFEAPEHPQNYANYWFDSPDRIVEHAIAGESSDRLRGKVDDYFRHVTKDLQKSVVKLDDLYPEGNGIYCGLCRTCDKRMASRNLCFLPECFEAKVEHKQREYLSAASISSGYPLSDENKGGHVSQPYSDKMEIIRKTGCPNLCLVYSEGEVREPYNIKGFPHAYLVCDKRNDSCSCQKGLNVRAVLKAESRPAVQIPENIEIDNDGFHEEEPIVDTPVQITSSELEEAARQARKDKRFAIEQHGKVNEILAKMLVQALKDDDPGAFYVVVTHYIWPNDSDLEIERLYRRMASEAAMRIVPPDYDSMDDLVEKTNRNLARLHLPAISLQKTLVELFEEEEEKANEMSDL